MACHLFISDLHLDADGSSHADGSHVKALGELCATKLAPGYKLYILGDLFETWLGDDLGVNDYQNVCQLLRQQVDAGVEVFVQHGNRDFLLGAQFEQLTGCQLIPDEHLIVIGNQKVLLMHGDSLVTDDVDYQTLRQQFRDPAWQADMLAKSEAERRAMADYYRQLSQQATAAKAEVIMDVNARAVDEVMAKHQADMLIHGHTHRPHVHQQSQYTRVVLGDWRDHFYYLAWPDDGSWLFLRGEVKG